MKTCVECGQAMNDNDDFCMNCGAHALQARCAACGQTVAGDADFCMNCGAHIVRQASTSCINFLLIQNEASTEKASKSAKKQTEKGSEEKTVEEKSMSVAREIHVKVYSALHYVPITLLSLYTVLLFLFFLVPNGGWGNTYVIGGKVISIFFLSFGGTTLVYTVVALLYVFAKKKPRVVSVFGLFAAPLGEVLSVASFTVYLAFIVLSSIDIGTAEYTWWGEKLPCTASELILAFAFIFMLLEFAAIATRVVLEKKFPALAPQKNKKSDAEVEARSHANETSSLSATKMRSINTIIAPDKDKEYTRDEAEKQSYEEGKRPLMYYMVSNKRLLRAMNLGYLGFFFTVIGLVICWILHTWAISILVSPHLLVVIGASVTLFLWLIGYALPVKNVSAENLRLSVMRNQEIDMLKFPICKLMFLLIIIFCWFIHSMITDMMYRGEFLRGYIIAMVFCLCGSLLYVLGARAVAKRNAAMAIYLWGWMSPTVDTPFVVDYDEEKERAAYEKYMSEPSVMRDMNEDDSTERHIRNRRIAVGVMTALFVAITAVVVPVSETVTDKFSANYAKHSVLPKEISVDTLRRLYGNFNFIRPYGDGCVVEYYSDNWLELYEEYYDLSEKIESGDDSITVPLVSRMKELELKMATLEYKYLSIYFNDEYRIYVEDLHDYKYSYNYLEDDKIGHLYGDVIGIVLDKARGGMSLKQVKETNFDCPTLWQRQMSTDVSASYEIWYDDGSYMWQKFTLPKLDTSQIGVQTFTITDAWGGVHNINVQVVGR